MRRLLLPCIICIYLVTALARAETSTPRYNLGDSANFWVWDLSQMPPAFRQVEAIATQIGSASYIFVEKSLWQNVVFDEQIRDLYTRLEIRGKPESLYPNLGIIPLEEKIFAPLPSIIRPDSRVVVLIADLGQYAGHSFDGFFNTFDQLPENAAWSQYQQHSNETNLIYIHASLNEGGFNVEHTASIISHELQHLLAHYARGINPPAEQEPWLAEAQAESAMLFAGYFTDQTAIYNFAKKTWATPLVSQPYVFYGPSILFASYLIDRLGNYGGFDQIMKNTEVGRKAVELAFLDITGEATTFDALFGDFISYLFSASNTQESLPGSWLQISSHGLRVPNLDRAGTITTLPFTDEAEISPYGFAIYELAQEIPPDTAVRLEILGINANDGYDIPPCQDNLQLLWKPLPGAIAVYAVGCSFENKRAKLRYRVSLYELNPLKK